MRSLELIILPGSSGAALEQDPSLHDLLDRVEKEILAAVSTHPVSVEDLLASLADGVAAAAGIESAADLARKLVEMERKGLVRIRFPARDRSLEEVHEGIRRAREACVRDPGLWNVFAYDLEWERYRDYFDFLDPDAPNHFLKQFELELYMRQIEDLLTSEVPPGGRILDAGGGVGRFAAELLGRGYQVVLLDASEKALTCALRHFLEQGFEGYTLRQGDVRDLSGFPDHSFDAVFGMELLCYTAEPERALQEMVRVLSPGGCMFLSVEGKYGSLLTDTKIGLQQFADVYRRDQLLRENDVFVRYFTDEEFRRILEEHGLIVLDVKGSHYVPDGVLHRFLEDGAGPPERTDALLHEIEDACSRDAVLQPLARAWTALCRKPS